MRTTTPRYIVCLCAIGSSVFPSTDSLLAQSAALDQGTFEIQIDGQPAGAEEFLIRRAGTGAGTQIYATAEIELDLPEGRVAMSPVLQTVGGEMAVSGYQIAISGDVQEEISLRLGDRRFTRTLRSERGEQEREMRAAPGTLLLDTHVAHQYYFLANRVGGESGSVPVVVPRGGEQFDLRVSEQGRESIMVGGTAVDARRLSMDGGPSTGSLWIDDQGRVLKVELSGSGYVATRTTLP